MMYLHENKEAFAYAVNLAATRHKVTPQAVEKDYYMTMALRELSRRLDFVVFKGATSLFKAYGAIRRFSEDIDIAADASLSQGQKKKLKKAIQETAETLGLGIPNIDETRSRRDYNRYILEYESVAVLPDMPVSSHVILETSFAEVSFPTASLPIHSFIGDTLRAMAPESPEAHLLEPFEMKVQAIERSLADKVFALCDYYLQGRIKKHSRHIYDIYKILPLVPQTEAFQELVREVRRVRAKTTICPSAQSGVNVPEILKHLTDSGVYQEDYETVTSRNLAEDVPYETAIEAVRAIALSGIFEEAAPSAPDSSGGNEAAGSASA